MKPKSKSVARLESLRQRCADVLEGTLEIRDHNDKVLAKFSTDAIRNRILGLPLVVPEET